MKDEESRDLLDQLAAVTRELRALRADLDAHRAQLERELSTRRVVIRSTDGFPRIVLVADDDSGHLVLNSRSPEPVTCAELFAGDPSPEMAAQAGLALTDAGDIVATLDLIAGEGAALWIDQDRTQADPG